jgi:hypothetical protein
MALFCRNSRRENGLIVFIGMIFKAGLKGRNAGQWGRQGRKFEGGIKEQTLIEGPKPGDFRFLC